MSSFSWIRTTFPFFHSDGKEPLPIDCLKMIVLTWPCALLQSTFCCIFAMSSMEKFTVSKRLSVLKCKREGSLLYFFIIKHWLAKKELRSFGFVKLVTKLIKGIFYYLEMFNWHYHVAAWHLWKNSAFQVDSTETGRIAIAHLFSWSDHLAYS